MSIHNLRRHSGTLRWLEVRPAVIVAAQVGKEFPGLATISYERREQVLLPRQCRAHEPPSHPLHFRSS